ncbi:Na+/melibiose symporter-like transporter [Dietzia kunjamensis]|uniref:MFS transporter n=1 Tax=Dietzia kunjamensis TaxID=322509 RepID=UPI000FF179E3|nr:MFS transporter [Dietzia kunjamensis]RKE62580.1 Na+/melibiose symporter-like transporter [Dietzia kunjamensis]
MVTTAERFYSRLVTRDADAERDLPDVVRRELPRNGLRLVAANTLQSSGDQTVNASTVLPWLFHVLGVPAALVGLLVPIRESGSMLPQAFLTPLVVRVRRRKWVFVTGALVQAASVAAMAAIAALGHGTAAGVGILVALVVFSLGRCLCSIASKDVQGRTIPSGERGQIIGLATSAAGLVAITLGLAIRILGGGDLDSTELAFLLVAGAVLWLLSASTYSRVVEPAVERRPRGDTKDSDTEDGDASSSWFADAARLFRDDATFRKFVTVRGLLLVSSLSPPFIVSMSVASGTGALAGLGGFILASGVASLIGGRVFGRLADRSSRLLMAGAATAASAVAVALVLAVSVPGFDGGSALGVTVFVGAYFLLTLLHSGVRVGRKTYVVDVAEGDLRTTYVAVGNTAMGIILLVVGGISSALAVLGVQWALIFLAVLGVIGAVSAVTMPEVSRGAAR